MSYKLIDTHSHIYTPAFQEDIDDVMRRCQKAGVEQVYLPNIDIESIGQVKTLVTNYPSQVKPMMGLHPCSVDNSFLKVLSKIKEELFKNKADYIAVGEIGIDLYWDKTYLKQQQEAFEEQIDWAIELNLPICIHARDSFEEIYEILLEKNCPGLTGVWHCFSGTLEQAEKILSLEDFFLGIGGVVTFKNAGLDKVVQELPLHKLLLETDAPYLTPVPYRGKRNESSYIQYVAQKIAELHQEDVKTVADITTANAKALFKQ